jgi:hypothetical protein
LQKKGDKKNFSQNSNPHPKQSEFAGDWQRRQQDIKFIKKYRTAYLTRAVQTVDTIHRKL